MSQKSGPQLPVNSDAQRSKPGFGTVERFGRVVIAHDNVLYHAYNEAMTPGAIQVQSPSLPSIFTAQPQARKRMRDFFSSHIRNANTRRAYLEAVRQFSAYCAGIGIVDLAQVEPIHVAAFVEAQLREHSKPTVKQRLAALRMLFDWMVVGQVIPVNPAHAVRGPKYTQRRGKTPVLQADEARALLDAIDTTSLPGLRDRALIGLMVYTFARVGAAVSMRVEDFFVQGRRGWVRLHEKGGKEHEMPTHHNLDRYLEEYMAAAGIGKGQQAGAQGAAVPHRQGPHRGADRQSPAPVRCLADDSPAGQPGRHRDRDRLPHLPRHRDHGLPQERRPAGDRPADGRP
jgi:site-specific recombinase XerC